MAASLRCSRTTGPSPVSLALDRSRLARAGEASGRSPYGFTVTSVSTDAPIVLSGFFAPQLTEQAKTLRTSRDGGVFCKPSRKRPFVAPAEDEAGPDWGRPAGRDSSDPCEGSATTAVQLFEPTAKP